jgi:hypothetical protein
MTSAIGTVSQTPTTEEQLCSQCIKLNLRRYLAPLTLRMYWDLPMRITFDHVLPVMQAASTKHKTRIPKFPHVNQGGRIRGTRRHPDAGG